MTLSHNIEMKNMFRYVLGAFFGNIFIKITKNLAPSAGRGQGRPRLPLLPLLPLLDSQAAPVAP